MKKTKDIGPKESSDARNGNEELKEIRKILSKRDLPVDTKDFLLREDETIISKMHILNMEALEKLSLIRGAFDNDDLTDRWAEDLSEPAYFEFYGVKTLINEVWNLLDASNSIYTHTQ